MTTKNNATRGQRVAKHRNSELTVNHFNSTTSPIHVKPQTAHIAQNVAHVGASRWFIEPARLLVLASVEDEVGRAWVAALVADGAGRLRVISPDRELPKSVQEAVLDAWQRGVDCE